MMAEIRPNTREIQENAIEQLSRPKHPRQYTLEELMLLSREERNRILSEAEFETFNPDEFWDNNPGEGFLQPEAALDILNSVIENDQDEMSALDVLNVIFSNLGRVEFEDNKFVFIPSSGA